MRDHRRLDADFEAKIVWRDAARPQAVDAAASGNLKHAVL